MSIVILLIIVLAVLVRLVKSFRVVAQASVMVIERLGRFTSWPRAGSGPA
jgi:regulator of protease activity HflC (stomatin/prohibitin superfamily)